MNLSDTYRLYNNKNKQSLDRFRLFVRQALQLQQHYNMPNYNEMFAIKKNPKLRGYGLRLEFQPATTKPYKHFIVNRVIRHWNELPEDIITAESLNQFKNRLDKHLSMEQ